MEPYKYNPVETAAALNGNAFVYETGLDTTLGNVLCDIVSERISGASVYFTETEFNLLRTMMSRLSTHLAFPGSLGNYVTVELYADAAKIDGLGVSVLNSREFFWKRDGANFATIQPGYNRYIHLYDTSVFQGVSSVRLKLIYNGAATQN